MHRPTPRALTTLVAACAALVPAVALAHPGHAAASEPAVHAWSHALPFVLVAVALGLGGWWIVGQTRRARASVPAKKR